MKCIVIAVLFAVMQTPLPVPREAANDSSRASHDVKNHPNANKAKPAQSSPSINAKTAPRDKNSGKAVAAENTQQPIRVGELPSVTITKDWADYAYWAFSGLLVLVGFFQALLLYGTLKAIQRQALRMKQQTRILKDSVTLAKTSADAAKASAEAAKENIGIFISKDRARIRVELENLNLEPLLDDTLLQLARYRVELHGSTEAFIVDTVAYAYVSNSPIPEYSGFNPPMGLPAVIKPASPISQHTAFLWPKFNLTPSEIEREVTQGRSFVHFHGFIKYRDVFEMERETKFKYMWRLFDSPIGSASGYWVKCGTKDDNAET